MNEQRNFIVAMALSALILIGWWFFYQGPAAEKAKADAQAEMARVRSEQSIDAPTTQKKFVALPREELISQSEGPGQRIKIDSPSLIGSLSTSGFQFDDVTLKNYDKTLDPAEGQVSLLSPHGSDKAAVITDNWVRSGAGNKGLESNWTILSGETLTPNSPVELGYQGDGFEVRRKVSVDSRYLLTLDDTVTNTSGAEISLQRVGVSRQYGLPNDLTNFFIIQEGPIAILDNAYSDMKYKSLRKKGAWSETGVGGWVGLTDKYWLTAAIAPQGSTITADRQFRTVDNEDVYETSYTVAPMTLTSGTSITSTGYMFAGAKDRGVLKGYETDLGIDQMERAIDWGFVGILVKPISWALSALGQFFGNFGLGILALTLIIKLLMFPLFNKQYESQAKMKKVQPKLKKLQARYKDDRVKLQKEMMALYKTEGVNPAAGCLPVIPTIFVFFALYKAVFINIHMRHAPFFGWIQDLSAKDPASILNGFGIFPWSPDPVGIAFLAIGPLALLYGVTMSLMYTLTPPAADPMQARIFKFMPWVFMFIMAPFPAGLLIYWVWNNTLSFGQQYYITRKFKVDTPIDQFFRKITGKEKAETAD